MARTPPGMQSAYSLRASIRWDSKSPSVSAPANECSAHLKKPRPGRSRAAPKGGRRRPSTSGNRTRWPISSFDALAKHPLSFGLPQQRGSMPWPAGQLSCLHNPTKTHVLTAAGAVNSLPMSNQTLPLQLPGRRAGRTLRLPAWSGEPSDG